MNMQGYIIAQNNLKTSFFVASSAYDRPKWTNIAEATVYPTAELASKAMEKLFAYGSYSARLIEASSMEFEFPDEGPNKNIGSITQTTPSPTDEMKADQLSDDDDQDELNLDDDEISMDRDDNDNDDDEEDDHNIDHEDNDDDDDYDDNYPHSDENNEQSFLSPLERNLMKGERSNYPTGSGPTRESFEFPTKPVLDAKPTENKKTVHDYKKPERVKFKQDNRVERDTNFGGDIEELYKELKVPRHIMTQIADAIKYYNEAADFNNGRDDAQASLSLTIVDALQMIQDCLKLNTYEGLKQAQIKITTLMSPIINNFPPEVIDYLYKSGRQPISLKNTFYTMWDNRS